MASYSKKTCYKCGIRLPQPEMLTKTVQVQTGNSRKTLSGTEVAFAVLGNKKAKSAVKRTFTSPNKRRYVRNKEVWECYKCAGVETPEDKEARLENQRILNEQLRLETEQNELRRKQQVIQRLGIGHADQNPRLLTKLVAREGVYEEGSMGGFIIRWIPQLLLSFGCLYIPLTDFYLRQFGLAVVKFFAFYVLAAVTVSLVGENNAGFFVIVPLMMGCADLMIGIRFFRGREPIASHLSNIPPPLPENASRIDKPLG